MTRVPMGSVATLFMKEGLGHYKSERLEEKYPGIMFSQFMGAEMLVKKYGLTKDDLVAYALESHRRGKAANEAGHFKRELVGVELDNPAGREKHHIDEGIRLDAALTGIAVVNILTEDGPTTAATRSPLRFGA